MKKKEIRKSEIDSLALEIMEEFNSQGEGTTLEEAREMARMELANKENRRYEQSDKPRKPSSRERKVDEDKKHLLHCIKILVEGLGGVVTSIKNEAEFSFKFKEDSYTVKLIKHRPPKAV